MILRQAAGDLAEMAVAVLRRLRLNHRSTPVFITGGVFSDTRTVRPAFIRILRTLAPRARVRDPRFPPVIGAVLLALRDCGRPWNAEILARLEATWAVMDTRG